MCNNPEHRKEQDEIKTMLVGISESVNALVVDMAVIKTELTNVKTGQTDQEVRLRVIEKESDRNTRSLKVLMSVTGAIGLAAVGGLVDIVTRLIGR